MAYKKVKYWFDKELAEMLSEKIAEVRKDFPVNKFIKTIEEETDDLELKDRIEVFADALHEDLGGDYAENVEVLMKILGSENEEETGMFTNFYWLMPVAFYTEKYGLEHFEKSMEAIKEITKRNTSEYAIRPYLDKYPAKTLKVLKKWSKDDNFHVRRLASEGVRPRLPWAKKSDAFVEDPTPILPVLENLKDDKVKYVQKSVANCINDIFKDNYHLAKDLINAWSKDNPGTERRWIMKHALRKLRKDEDAWAMNMTDSLKK